MGSTQPSAVPGGTRKSPGPRSAFSPSAPHSTAGTPRASGRSCGSSITPGSTRASPSGCSRSPTGPSWTSGSTSTWKTFPSCPFTTRLFAQSWCASTRRRRLTHGVDVDVDALKHRGVRPPLQTFFVRLRPHDAVEPRANFLRTFLRVTLEAQPNTVRTFVEVDPHAVGYEIEYRNEHPNTWSSCFVQRHATCSLLSTLF